MEIVRVAVRTRFFLFLGLGRTAGTAASGGLFFGFCRAACAAARAGGLVGEGGYKTS